MLYNAPDWKNNSSPALNAENLQAISDALEQDGEEIQTLQTQLANPFNYKGVVANVASLPSSGNTINDTYYVTAATCLYSWNGSAWSVSSMSEVDYMATLQNIMDDIAEEYDATSAYAVGDYCIYNEKLYKCNTAITTAEAWTSGHWTRVSVTQGIGDDITDLKSALDYSSNELYNFTFATKQIVNSTPLAKFSFQASAGQTVTIKNVTGQNFTRTFAVNFYDSEGNTVGNYTLMDTQSERSIVLASDIASIMAGDINLRDTIIISVDTDGFNAKKKIEEAESDIEGLKKFDQKHTTPSENLWTVVWEMGSLNLSSGKDENAVSVIRTAGFIDVEPETKYAFYDGRDWTKAEYNQSYAAQYLFEYDANGVFLRQSIIYTQQFTTGENTRKIRFRSGSVFTTEFDFNSFNALGFILVAGSTYRSYQSPVSVNIVPAYPFTGEKSDNLFDGKMFNTYLAGSTGVVNVNSSALMISTDWIKVSKTEHDSVWYTVFRWPGTPTIGRVIYYDANKIHLGSAYTATVDTTAGRISRADLVDGTEYIILATGEYAYSAETEQELTNLKLAAENSLFVVTNLNYIYHNKQIDGSNKINGGNTNIGFLHKIRFESIRDFMVDGLKSYSDNLLAAGYDLQFSLMTDIHTRNLEPFSALNYMGLSGSVDFCCNLGDTITDHYDTKAEAVDCLRAVFKAQNDFTVKATVYNAVGNHDVNPVNAGNIPDASKMIHPNEFYGLAMERSQPGIVSGKAYGYHDFENAKIRVIILNTSDIFDNNGNALIDGYNTGLQQAQFTWFCHTALDFSGKADASEWSVITMCHDRLSTVGAGAFESVLTAFVTGGTANAYGSRVVNDYTFILTENVDYSAQGPVSYIGHFCGHMHEDKIENMGETQFKQILIGCAVRVAHYYDGGGNRQDYSRTPNTTDELLFDTACVDKSTRTVYLKRFGVGNDRQFTY